MMIYPEMSLKQIQPIRNRTILTPPPIYIYGVTDNTGMAETVAKAVDEETYFTKTLSNNTVRISSLSSETYRRLISNIKDEKIIHTT
jgi:hypothetical protein